MLRIFFATLIWIVVCEFGEFSDIDISNANENEHSPKERHDIGDLKESSYEDLGEVLESMLHDGEHRVHSETPQASDILDTTNGTFDLDVELEALLHDDDGHIHDKTEGSSESHKNGFLFDVKDPDHLLHDGDSHFHDLLKEAIDGSRPIRGSDPTLVDNPQVEQATIGTLNPDDFQDYKSWRETKEKGKESGWFDGFSFLNSIFRYDMEIFKERYLLTRKQNLKKHDEG